MPRPRIFQKYWTEPYLITWPDSSRDEYGSTIPRVLKLGGYEGVPDIVRGNVIVPLCYVTQELVLRHCVIDGWLEIIGVLRRLQMLDVVITESLYLEQLKLTLFSRVDLVDVRVTGETIVGSRRTRRRLQQAAPDLNITMGSLRSRQSPPYRRII